MIKAKNNKLVKIERAIVELILPADADLLEAAKLYRRSRIALTAKGEDEENRLRAMPLGEVFKAMLKMSIEGYDLKLSELRDTTPRDEAAMEAKKRRTAKAS